MRYALVAALLMFSAAPALSMDNMASLGKGPGLPTFQPNHSYRDTSADTRKNQRIRYELIALRDEGLKLRDADGGSLTDEHRAYLQGKLDAIRTEARGAN
jgi:hypothetical protein